MKKIIFMLLLLCLLHVGEAKAQSTETGILRQIAVEETGASPEFFLETNSGNVNFFVGSFDKQQLLDLTNQKVKVYFKTSRKNLLIQKIEVENKDLLNSTMAVTNIVVLPLKYRFTTNGQYSTVQQADIDNAVAGLRDFFRKYYPLNITVSQLPTQTTTLSYADDGACTMTKAVNDTLNAANQVNAGAISTLVMGLSPKSCSFQGVAPVKVTLPGQFGYFTIPNNNLSVDLTVHESLHTLYARAHTGILRCAPAFSVPNDCTFVDSGAPWSVMGSGFSALIMKDEIEISQLIGAEVRYKVTEIALNNGQSVTVKLRRAVWVRNQPNAFDLLKIDANNGFYFYVATIDQRDVFGNPINGFGVYRSQGMGVTSNNSMIFLTNTGVVNDSVVECFNGQSEEFHDDLTNITLRIDCPSRTTGAINIFISK